MDLWKTSFLHKPVVFKFHGFMRIFQGRAYPFYSEPYVSGNTPNKGFNKQQKTFDKTAFGCPFRSPRKYAGRPAGRLGRVLS